MEQSAEITELVKALMKAQSEIKPVTKDGNNPFFKSKYATLENVVNTSRDVLHNNGLVILQPMCGEPGSVGVKTILAHESGQWISGTLYLPLAKSDPQGAGSAITYARRYSWASMIGLVTDEDDDGNAASNKSRPHKMTDDQLKQVKRLFEYLTALNNSEEVAKQTILEECGVDNTKDIAVGVFDGIWRKYKKDVEEFESQTGGA